MESMREKPAAAAPLPLTIFAGRAGDALPAVLLRHTLPGGSWHVDLMIASKPVVSTDPDERPLVTFRLARPLWELACGESIEIARLADHRGRYLSYEGEISGDRGRVERLASGVVEPVSASAVRLAARSTWRLERRSRILEIAFEIERNGGNWRLRTGERPQSAAQ